MFASKPVPTYLNLIIAATTENVFDEFVVALGKLLFSFLYSENGNNSRHQSFPINHIPKKRVYGWVLLGYDCGYDSSNYYGVMKFGT